MCSHTYVFISSRPASPPPSSVTIVKVPVFVSSYNDSSCFDYSHCCRHGNGGHYGYGDNYGSHGSYNNDIYNNYGHHRPYHRPYTDAQFGVDLVCGSIAASGVAIADIIRAANGIEPKYGRKTEGSQQSDSSQGSSNTSSNKSVDESRAKELAASLERNKQVQSELSNLSSEVSRLNQLLDSLMSKDNNSTVQANDDKKNSEVSKNNQNVSVNDDKKSSEASKNNQNVSANDDKKSSEASKNNQNVSANDDKKSSADLIEKNDGKNSTAPTTGVGENNKASLVGFGDPVSIQKTDESNTDGDDLDALRKKAKSLNTDFTSVPEGKREVENQIPTIKAYNKWAAAIVKHSGEELSENVKKHVKEAIANLSYLVEHNAKEGDSATDPNVKSVVNEAKSLLAKLRAMK